jgi:gliding-associated putative ABC transporter substrate-binding component GldG
MSNEEIAQKSSSGSNRRLIKGTWATSGVLIAVAVAIAANLVASQTTMRWDMTEHKIYTLHSTSREAVRALPEAVEVKVFISPNLPAPLHTLEQSVSDLLDEYAAASGKKLTYTIVSPKDGDEEIEQTASGYGCQKVALGQQSENEVSLRAVYKCVAFVMGDKQQVIKELQATGSPELDNFEYDFTKALRSLTTERPSKVGFVAGFGGPAGSPEFARHVAPVFTQLYGELIVPVSVDLSGESPLKVPEDVGALVLLNPDQTFSELAKFEIDQFLQRGGSLGWFQSGLGVDEEIRAQLMQQLPGRQVPDIRSKLDPGLNDLFGVYGVQVAPGMVLDRENALTFGVVLTESGPAQVSHPATFQIVELDRSAPFLANMPPLALPAPTHIVLSEELKRRAGVEVKEVIRTAPSAVMRPDPPPAMNYTELIQPADGEQPGPFVVAATIQGELPSYYVQQPLPAGKTEQDLFKGSARARLLVVSSGDFFQVHQALGYDERLTGLGQQLLFNSLEWLAQDSALSEIRGKRMPRFVGEVPAERKRSMQFTNIVFVPTCFLGIGTLMWLRRRHRRRTLTL